jgi:hypothetical protein
LLLAIAFALVAGGCGGCGGAGGPSYAKWGGLSEEEYRKKRDEKGKAAADKAAADKAAEEKRQAEKKKAAPPATPPRVVSREPLPTREAEPPTTAASNELPPGPALPGDFGQWDEHDFHAARVQGDLRLPSALEHLAQRPRRTAEEAQMLTALLAQPISPPRGTGQPGAQTAVIRNAVAALGANGTPAAQAALAEVVAGTLRPLDEPAAVEAALGALAQLDTPASRQQLAAALLTPQSARPSGKGAVTPEVLRQKALAAVKAHGSRRLRSELARCAADSQTPPELRGLLLSVFREPNALNIEAQAVLYQGESVDAATRSTIEKQFVTLSGETLALTMALPPANSGGRPEGEDWAEQVAAHVWSPSFTDLLGIRQQGLRSLVEGADAVLLTATIPTAAARTQLHRRLARHRAEGGGVIRGSKGAAPALVEPGALVILKSLSREGAAAKTPRPTRSATRDPRVKLHEQQRGRVDDDLESAQAELVRTWCERCHAAALARAAAARRSGLPPGPRAASAETLRLTLHSDAAPAATWLVEWPGPWRQRLPHFADGDDAMQVGYVRLEEKTKPIRPIASYRRQLKSCEEHSLPDGVWLDGWLEPTAPGRRRSADVFITRTKADGPTPIDAEQHLTIEILVVEVHDPAGEGRVARAR